MPPVDSIPLGPDTIRILLTTDNHVGYLENDPIRGDDSWKTFQEITYLAKEHDVDMIVQGGDLFHVTKPSKKSLYHVIQSLRLNCLGDRPCELELLSDPAAALREGETVNYEDPNMNVSVPVFAISGNHDDATGEGLLLPLDVMAATGLINYFGQIPQLDKITVTPLVFQKGTTRLALYGINNMRDERLQRIMRNGDVTFQKPKDSDSFFNLMCIHQNHFRHTMTSYVPEDFLPSFLDFVLWGHEHECIPFPQYNPTTGFDTLQPGSSVATSLSEGETAEKHVFLLDIHAKLYAITPLPLRTVRPFVMKDVSLQNEHFVEGPSSKSDILAFLVQLVEDLIAEARLQSEKNGESEDILPLIRLRVDHTGDYEIENARRFSNKFVGRIANINDIILYHKKKSIQKGPELKLDKARIDPDNILKVSIQQILQEYLRESSLYLVPEEGMFNVTKKFIEQDDKQLFADYVELTVANATKLLLDVNIDEEEFHLGDDVSVKKSFRQLLNKLRYDTKRQPISENGWEAATNAADEVLKGPTKPASKGAYSKKSNAKVAEEDMLGDSEPEEVERVTKPRTQGARSKAKKKTEVSEESEISEGELAELDSDFEVEEIPQQKPRTKAATNTKRAASAKVTKATKATPKKAAPKKAAPRKATKKKSDQSLLDDILDFV